MITLSDAVESFLRAKEADGVKPGTIQYYRCVLQPVAAQLGDNQLDRVSADQLRAYVLTLRARTERYQHAPKRQVISGGLADETVRSHIGGLKVFWNWASAEFALRDNPMRHIRKPPAPRKVPKAIAPGDVRLLLEACGDTPQGLRDKALIAFMTESGCRAGGLLTLKAAQLDLVRCEAVVTEKGDKTRGVFFTSYTASLLRLWLAVRPPNAKYVFCSLRNTEIGAPLGISGLNQALRRLARKAGVKGRVNPHSFRHGFAREYLMNGGDLATLAQLMGHSNVIVTASSYAIFTDNELAGAHKRHGPHIESLGEGR